MEPPPALTNYLSNKVALTTKNGEKYGQNGMGGRRNTSYQGERRGEEEDTMGLGRRGCHFCISRQQFCGAWNKMRHRNAYFCGAVFSMCHRK